MKTLLAATAIALLPTIAFAATPHDAASLKTYATQALARCPDQKLTVERVDKESPLGFIPYLVTQTSSDSTCGRQTTLLYSPQTRQILMGSVFDLPTDMRAVDVRVAERAMEVLKEPLTASVSKFPLPDRIKSVSIYKQTQYGNF